MADQSASGGQNFGSAADLMIEALDKASAELDKTVQSCLEELSASNEALEKSLVNQLQKVVDQSKNFTESNVEDLTTHREELIDRLGEFERTEVETMVLAAREVRQQVALRGQQASASISKLVEEQIEELHSLIENPEARFANFHDKGAHELQGLINQSKLSIESDETSLEQALSQTASELDGKVQEVIRDTKKSIEDTLDKYNIEMEEKIASVVNQLSDVVSKTVSDLEQSAKAGSKKVEDAGNEGKNKLAEHLQQWTYECNSLSDSFKKGIDLDCANAEKSHHSKLERKVAEVKDEIVQIADEATTKITASHKLFFSSLKRLEKKYNDRLERLMAKFEAAVAEEAKIGSGSTTMQSAHELRELLHARLQARGQEILKSFHRQVELLESEYTRSGAGSSERLEQIRAAAIESLDKQVRDTKTQLDRTVRNFSEELGELNMQLPQIEEAGRAAALAVMAYRSAMLSFERD